MLDNVPRGLRPHRGADARVGLFVSHGITPDEAAVFNEPALFLFAPDGSVYYEAILSMPVGRPHLDDLLGGIDYWTANNYPARGGY